MTGPSLPLYCQDTTAATNIFARALLLAADDKTPEFVKLRDHIAQRSLPHDVNPYAGLSDMPLGFVEAAASNGSASYNFAISPISGLSLNCDAQKLQQELSTLLPRITSIVPTQSTAINPYHGPQVTFHFPSRVALMQSLHQSEHTPVQQLMQQVAHYESLVGDLPDVYGGAASSLEWARLAHGHRNLSGDYFPAQALVDKSTYFKWPTALNYSTLNNNGTSALQAAIDHLDEAHGIKRLKFLGKGASSAVFETVPDTLGLVQLVALSEPGLYENAAAHHPVNLPDRTQHMVDVGGNRILVRTTAKLHELDLTDGDMYRLHSLVEGSGAKASDLYNENNVRRFRTSDGELVTLSIDPGAISYHQELHNGRWLSPPEETKAQLQQSWQQDKRFDAHRRANAEIGAIQDTQNTFSHDLRKGLAELPPESSLRAAYHEKGMYPSELKAISQQALQRAMSENPANYTHYLREGIAAFDTSQSPFVQAIEAVEHAAPKLAIVASEVQLGAMNKIAHTALEWLKVITPKMRGLT